MKRTAKKLAPVALSLEKLGKVSGGRGGFCGGVIHCDCGCVFSPSVEQTDSAGPSCGSTVTYWVDQSHYCPACGASTGL